MLTSIIKFFFSPTNTVQNIQNFSLNSKIAIIIVSILFSTLINSIFSIFWILPFSFNILQYLFTFLLAVLFNLFFTAVIFFIGKSLKNKIKATFLDNLLFLVLSGVIFAFWTIANYVMTINWLLTWSFLWTFFFFWWSLVLLSKSLAKINGISEGRVTFLVIWSIAIIFTIDRILPFSILNPQSNIQLDPIDGQEVLTDKAMIESQFTEYTKGINCKYEFGTWLFSITSNSYMAPVLVDWVSSIALSVYDKHSDDEDIKRSLFYYNDSAFGYRWKEWDSEWTYFDKKINESSTNDLLSFYNESIKWLESTGIEAECKEWNPDLTFLKPSEEINFWADVEKVIVSLQE